MNKHTKGPWHIQYFPHCTAIYAGKKVVGYIDHFNEHDKKLVTSAPELLEALKYCRNKIAYMQAHGEWYSPGRAIEMADAAIAKATGEQA